MHRIARSLHISHSLTLVAAKQLKGERDVFEDSCSVMSPRTVTTNFALIGDQGSKGICMRITQ